MNPGLNIFKRMQRLQGGTEKVPPFPDDPPWPEEFNELMERLRRREMREPYPKESRRKKRNSRDVPIMDTETGRAFDPESLGNAFMAQGGEEDVPLAGRAARKMQDLSIEALQNLPEWLKDKIRHGVGRVATNVIDPYGYEDYVSGNSKLVEAAKLFSPQNLPHTISSIVQDRPAFTYKQDEPDADSEIEISSQKARRPLFREYFDLPTQDVDNVYTKHGKNFRINPESKNTTAQHVLKQFSGPMYRPKRTLLYPDADLEVPADVPGKAQTNMLSRFYHPEQPDKWDFDPHPEELARTKGKPLDTSLFGRMLLESIGKPAILETGGYYNPPPKEGVDVAENTGGGLQRGTGDVMDLERGNWPVSEEELKTLPDWLAHLLRGIPEKHTHGSQREQFMPRSVPVFQGPRGKFYDPNYSRKDERIMAKEGDTDVEPLKLAGGSSGLPRGFTSFWPGGGHFEGPYQVAAGSNILGGHPWQYYDIGNPQAPWIGLEGPRGSLGEWVNIPGESRRGRVIDVKQKGYGGYGILKKGQYDRKGNWIPGTGGQGGGGTIPGGPFQGWTPEAMGQWHEGTPPSQMGYEAFTGNTAGPGGQQLAYETTSYNIPGYGWVPRANLANAQASNNLWDYLNPWGGTSKGGSNTGAPTQRVIGTAVGTASNFIIPGLGFVTGPIARYITSLFQKNPGITREQVVQAVAAKAKEDPALVAPPPAPSGGSGFDPWGNPDIGNRWSGDFGRNLGGPSYDPMGLRSSYGQYGTGGGAYGHTVQNLSTAIGFGAGGGGAGAGDTSRFMGAAGYARPYSASEWANLPGSKKYAAPDLSTAEGGISPRASYEQYMQMYHPIGSVGSSTGYGGAAYSGGGPKGVGGGTPAFKPNVNQKVFAMGTSNVNPGLKLFHKQQTRKKP